MGTRLGQFPYPQLNRSCLLGVDDGPGGGGFVTYLFCWTVFFRASTEKQKVIHMSSHVLFISVWTIHKLKYKVRHHLYHV